LLPGLALTAPALLLNGGWTLVLAGALGTAAAMVLPLTWCRLAAGPAPVLPAALATRQPHLVVARGMQVAVLVLVCLGVLDIALHLRAAHVPTWQLLLPIALVAVWHAVTGSVVLALVATVASAGWLGYAFLGRTPWEFANLLTALALALPLPLALWHARRGHRRWPALLLVGVGAIPALAAGETMAVGGAALAACLAVVLCAPRPLPALEAASGLPDADTVLARARRACQRLTPYWRHYGTAKLRYDPVYRQLAEHSLPWGRVLDAGCGPGLVAALASTRGEPAYCGIDLDEGKLEAAADLLGQLSQPLAGDWRLLRAKLPLAQVPPNRFDTALLIDVLHYWPEPEQESLLHQLHAMLERGGRLILRDGVSDAAGDTGVVGFSERLTTFFGLNPGGSGLHFLSEEAMREMLTRCGFSVQSVEPSGGANRLWRCVALAAADTPATDAPAAQ
jgi:SAM-dependent methyltransferase